MSRFARRRSVHAMAFASALMLFTSSCTRLDVKPAVAVKAVPVDLAFGGDRPDEKESKGATQPEPQLTLELPPPPPAPKFDFDFEDVAPTEECVITKPSSRVGVVQQMTDEHRSRAGQYLYRYDVTPAGKDKVSDVGFMEVGRSIPLPSGQNGFYWLMDDKYTGMQWVWKTQFGADNSGINPTIGFYLDRLGIPAELGEAPEMDDIVSRALTSRGDLANDNADGMIQPLPSLQLMTFPVQLGDKFTSVGVDPFSRVAFTSTTKVVDVDNRVEECDERVSGYKVEWDLKVTGAIEQTIKGTFWFNTSMGGMPVKADFEMGGFFLPGHYSFNVHDLDAI